MPARKAKMTVPLSTLCNMLDTPPETTLVSVDLVEDPPSLVLHLEGEDLPPLGNGEPDVPYRIERRGPFSAAVWLTPQGKPMSRNRTSRSPRRGRPPLTPQQLQARREAEAENNARAMRYRQTVDEARRARKTESRSKRQK